MEKMPISGNVDTKRPSDQIIEESDDIYIDPVLESKVMHKFDRWMLPQFALLNLLSFLDRSNIGQCRGIPF